ncbi:MAG: class I SAM-dependent methyltransferase [Candidatus Absconditabacterales bacterium]
MYLGYIKKLLKQFVPKKILDLGAGRGESSELCAKMGANVTAIDNCSRENWQRNKKLNEYKNITFINCKIEEFVPKITQNFNMIILLNIIAFLDKQDFLNIYFPKIIQHTNIGGIIIINFFFDDDPTMQKINHYKFEDFDFLENDFEIIKKSDIWKDDKHKPYGVHKHHIGYLILKKK